ncbi:uncharacterized protein LTR77_007431 [Saxophila tyrrhenica]|uniref:F-box domain-containing protein n=1 Tax=Saxophila tyrrhenica TaxID=1690608 RepID=A0AAV9P8G4_9PEZI|nr:hypothetical protein LTR77_007431 [Saxophila tyrrhenica]
MATEPALLDLPTELLLHVFSYLDVPSFLNTTSTCKTLRKEDFLYDSRYWSSQLRTTFRVPNQPAIQHGGDRYYKLFKRMHTQSRVYTWGDNSFGALGHSLSQAILAGVTRREVLRRKHISWPEKMLQMDELGIISDIQCGGWSTTLLNSKGTLYTVGVMNGMNAQRTYTQRTTFEPKPLRYPPGFTHLHARYDPSTTVRQFSSGREHVLALTDSGRIWSWTSIDQASLHVKFIHHDTTENGNGGGKGTVKKVVAGWSKSAALIEGTGIVIWEPLQRAEGDNELEDAALVLNSVVVPKTSFLQVGNQDSDRLRRQLNNPGTDAVGEVRNFIVLEDVVIFNTHLGKVFVSQIWWNDRGEMASTPFELPLPEHTDGAAAFATDVQGSFQSFGVFTRSGAVYTGKQDRVMDLMHGKLGDKALFTTVPALQHKDVIQLAFGDYHFHALHAAGYITSYGTEPQCCGALGLGGHGTPEGRLRGIRYQGAGGDGRLIPHAYTEGRRIWFEREKRAWVDFLTSGGVDPGEAQERIRMALGTPGMQCQGEVSEWIEQEGRDWESRFGVKSGDDDGLGAYFALSVTAAGWHSGALVLENSDLVERLRRACELPDPSAELITTAESSEQSKPGNTSDPAQSSSYLNLAFETGTDWLRWGLGMPPYDAQTLAQAAERSRSGTPNMAQFKRGTHLINFGAAPRVGYLYKWANDHFPRLQLSDGTEMPGEIGFDEWRFERPVWDVDFAL